MNSHFTGDPPEFSRTLKALLTDRYRKVAGALVTYAHACRQGESQLSFITGCWTFLDSKRRARQKQDYGTLLLGERWVPADIAIQKLEGLLRGRRQLGGIRIRPALDRVTGDRKVSMSQNYSGWSSEYVFEAHSQTSRSPRVPHHEVVGHGLRPFASGAEAITEWVWGRSDWHGGDPPHTNELVIVLPDTRAKIVKAEWKENKLRVVTDSKVPPRELQVQVGGTDGTQRHPDEDGVCEFQVSDDRRSAEVFLVHLNRELLGRIEVFPSHEESFGDREQLDLSQQATLDLRNGEDHRVEFKPFVQRGDAKEAELLETVVAFANTDGGRMYVGVDDSGVPQRTAELFKAFGSSDDPVSVLISHLNKLVREKTKPVPKLTTKPLEVFGERVVVVVVEKGDEPPYSTHDNHVWIRKGASNRRPDPHTELRALYDRKSPSFPFE